MNKDEFNRRFLEALKTTYAEKRRASTSILDRLGVNLINVAIGVYTDEYDRENGTLGFARDKPSAEAYRQAVVAYLILLEVDDMEATQVAMREAWTNLKSRGEDTQLAARSMTNSFQTMDRWSDIEREARRVLTGLGLPSTLEGLMDADYWIEIDLVSCKLSDADYMFDLQERFAKLAEPDNSGSS